MCSNVFVASGFELSLLQAEIGQSLLPFVMIVVNLELCFW